MSVHYRTKKSRLQKLPYNGTIDKSNQSIWSLRMGLISLGCLAAFILLSPQTGGLKNESTRFFWLMLIVAPPIISALGILYAFRGQRNWMSIAGFLLCFGIFALYGTIAATIFLPQKH